MSEDQPSRVFLLALKGPLSLEVIQSLEFVPLPVPEGGIDFSQLPPPAPPPVVAPPPVTPPQPPGTDFPWVGAGSVGPKFNQAPANVKDAISWFFPQPQWENAANVSNCESGWNPNAHNDTTAIYGPCGTRYMHPTLGPAQTENSWGIWQIDVCQHPLNPDQCRNVWTATEYAAGLWARGGWGSWTCGRTLGL